MDGVNNPLGPARNLCFADFSGSKEALRKFPGMRCAQCEHIHHASTVKKKSIYVSNHVCLLAAKMTGYKKKKTWPRIRFIPASALACKYFEKAEVKPKW